MKWGQRDVRFWTLRLTTLLITLSAVGLLPTPVDAAGASRSQGQLALVGRATFQLPPGGIHYGLCPGAACPFNYEQPPKPTKDQPCPGQSTPATSGVELAASAKADSSGNVTSVSQTVSFGVAFSSYLWDIDAPMCWYVVNSGSGTTLGAFGTIDVNGVYLVPQDGHSMLLVTPSNAQSDAGGTIIRASNPRGPAIYSIEVPSNNTDPNWLTNGDGGGSPVIVGQVDLGSDSGTVWDYNSSTGVLGGFGASPQAITFAGRPAIGGQILEGDLGFYPGQATTQLTVPLPATLTTAPSGSVAATAQFSYYTDIVGGNGGGNGGGGGSGGGPPPPWPSICYQTNFKANGCGRPGIMQAPYIPAQASSHRAAHAASSQPLRFSVPDVYLGGLELHGVEIEYSSTQRAGCSSPGSWFAFGKLTLLNYELSGGFVLCGSGSFLSGGATLSGDAPIVPGVVDLTSLSAGMAVHPTKLTGGATLSVLGGLASVNGCFLVVFPSVTEPYLYSPGDLCSGAPGFLQRGILPITSFATGAAGQAALNLPIFGSVPFGSAYGFYINPGYFEFGGKFDVNLVIGDINGGVQGWFELDRGRFNLEGNIQACINWPIDGSSCIGVNGVLSSVGVGGCGSFLGASVYGWYQWSGNWDIDFGCDLGPVTASIARSARTAASPISITVPAGVPVTSIRLKSSAGAPVVSVSGPSGQRAANPSTERGTLSGQIGIAPFPKLHETVVGIFNGGGGTWTITPQPGSPPITASAYRFGLARARIAATVTAGGQGGPYALSYSLRPRSGQHVTFVERAPGVYHIIGDATGQAGRLTFTPALGPAGRRQIVALVDLSGEPARNVVAGSYFAPGTPRAGRPTHLLLLRRGGALAVVWTPGAHAGPHLVQLTLADGRRLLFRVGAGVDSLTVPGVRGELGAHAVVIPLGPDGAPGTAAVARLPSGAPGRVGGITATVTASGVVVAWQSVQGASAYVIHVLVAGSASARLIASSRTTTLPPSALLAALGKGTFARISVRAINSAGVVGPPGVRLYVPPPTIHVPPPCAKRCV